MILFIVELEKGVWLDTGDGDPSRTCVKDNAYRFTTCNQAERFLADARKFRPFKNAEIEIV